MSIEIILDILLSAFVLMVYHSDCQQQPSMVYACASEPPLFANHQEYYTRQVSPENYESSDVTHLITEDDVWVTDPMTTPELDDLTLGELFAAADAIVPMEAEVADELQQLDEEVDLLLPVRTKVATVKQLKVLLTLLGCATFGTKGVVVQRVVSEFDGRGIIQSIDMDFNTFILSDDKQSVLVLLK